MPDPFSTLPMPLPLLILEAIEDLSTLNYVLQSSPVANRVFDRYYCQITEAVLANFVPQLQQLLRTLITIRSNHLSIREELHSREALVRFLHDRVLNQSSGVKPLSNASVSLLAVESLIKCASHIQHNSACFFDKTLRRNYTRPSYLSQESFDYEDLHDYLIVEHYHQSHLAGRPYEPWKCRLPSWVEEQQIYRAVLRLQLYLDLSIITRPSLGHTQEWDLLRFGGNRVRGKLIRLWERDEMDCV